MDTRLSQVLFTPSQDLQWSHGPSAMDTSTRRADVPCSRAPSMEPWPFSHGYIHQARRRPLFPCTFNGAMALQPWIPAVPLQVVARPGLTRWPDLQWSHGPSAMDTVQRFRAFFTGVVPSMEPWPFSHGYIRAGGRGNSLGYLQWSHGPSAMDTLLDLINNPTFDPPSMEPWPFSHGYRRPFRLCHRWNCTFNGAMALQPWIPCPPRRHRCQ